jgi:hypothetical protein
MQPSRSPQWNPSDPSSPAIFPAGRTESLRAHQALLDFISLGPGRTIPALLQSYLQLRSAPTRSLGTLRNWSDQYAWTARAAACDALAGLRRQAELRARREAILQRGLALEHERIERLAGLYEKLSALAVDEEAFWVRDVRFQRLPDGSTERVELRRFNGALVRSLRGLLDDIAGETGGRTLRAPLLPDDKPALDPGDYSLDVLTPSERAEFFRLQNKIFSPATRQPE